MENWKPDHVNSKTIYIICPDISCNGFLEDRLKCTMSPKSYMKNKPEDVCPHYDKGKKVLFCFNGHPNGMELDECSWQRIDCKCGASSFQLMSGKYHRVPLENYEEFLKIPFKKK